MFRCRPRKAQKVIIVFLEQDSFFIISTKTLPLKTIHVVRGLNLGPYSTHLKFLPIEMLISVEITSEKTTNHILTKY